MRLILFIILLGAVFNAFSATELDDTLASLDRYLVTENELKFNDYVQNNETKIDLSKIWYPVYLQGNGCLVLNGIRKNKKRIHFSYHAQLSKKVETWIPLFSSYKKTAYWEITL